MKPTETIAAGKLVLVAGAAVAAWWVYRQAKYSVSEFAKDPIGKTANAVDVRQSAPTSALGTAQTAVADVTYSMTEWWRRAFSSARWGDDPK